MFDLDPSKLRFALLAVIVMVLSCAVHEWAHAFTAVKLGDDTPARQGRLTLNPLVHIDPIGTLLMPAVGAFVGFLFGWAKPVQFSPHRFTRKISMQRGILLVALAGPVSNLILAVICAGLLKLILVATNPAVFYGSEVAVMAGALLFTGVWLNIVLFLFNFLPVYPLDGSRILEGLLPRKHHGILEVMQRNAMLIMILVFVLGSRLLVGPIWSIFGLLLDVFAIPGGSLAPIISIL